MTTYYASARAIDPGTGEWEYDQATQNWPDGAPMLQTAILALRTPLGRCLCDPSFGVDYSVVQKATADVGARWAAAVKECLSRWVKAGQITDLQVTVDVERGVTPRLFYAVSFIDPRIPLDRQTTGRLAVTLG